MSAVLELIATSKRYRDVRAVDNLSLSVREGEILALVGESGCGKTTTLRAIMGFEDIDSGAIRYQGKVIATPGKGVPPERRGIGMVFQDFALFPHMTVAANVAYGIKGRIPKRTIERATTSDTARRRVQEMLELVGLTGYDARYPHELSGGQRQRVALARALAPSPALLLLDEPFNSLDGSLKAAVMDEVGDIIRASATAAIVVTHDPQEALGLADRIAVLQKGSLLQVDTPKRIFDAPADEVVARFFGPVNAFVGRVENAVILTPLGELCAEVEPRWGNHDAGRVLVRPEHLAMTTGPGAEARVQRVRYRGEKLDLHLIEVRSGVSIRAVVSADRCVQQGEIVRICITKGVFCSPHRREGVPLLPARHTAVPV